MPLASESVAIDFPYTVGYSYDGAIDRNGWLLIDSEKQGIVLKSPECSVVPGLYEVTVVYEVAEENIDMLDVELEIASQNGSQVLLSEKLAANQDAVTVSNVNILSVFNLNVQVRKNSPGVISIHKLIFERIGEPIS